MPRKTRACVSVVASFAELRLDLLRVLEMGDERRPYLDDESLQLLVLGVRDERLVHRVDHRLMIAHLVIDVRLVERGAAQALQVLDVGLATLLEALARRIVLRLTPSFLTRSVACLLTPV
jgi:hypothetical protein